MSIEDRDLSEYRAHARRTKEVQLANDTEVYYRAQQIAERKQKGLNTHSLEMQLQLAFTAMITATHELLGR